MHRVYNFGAGPATLPLEVLEEAREELIDFRETGMSIMETSHRAPAYAAVHAETEANIRELLQLDDTYAVLFLQGGASGQFAMLPMNFLSPGKTAAYTLSGNWAEKAVAEARRVGDVRIAADCARERPARVPFANEIAGDEDAAYLHLTSNETISGAQWQKFPSSKAPIVADMSSDILSRPLDVSRFTMIYAGAQKNLGPSGVTLVILRREWADTATESIPKILRYQTHIEAGGRYNTPPCFSVYMMMRVTRWIKRQGLESIFARNREKADLLYETIDATDFYRGVALPECRSNMNVTFRLPSEELEAEFVRQAEEHAMKGLKGHRSAGGIRASIYNAFPLEGVQALATFMREFERRHG